MSARTMRLQNAERRREEAWAKLLPLQPHVAFRFNTPDVIAFEGTKAECDAFVEAKDRSRGWRVDPST